MFIRTEETPNNETLKFIPDGKIILENSTAEFKNQKQASTKSPLATQLFEIAGVSSIFFGSDFVSITKNSDIMNIIASIRKNCRNNRLYYRPSRKTQIALA